MNLKVVYDDYLGDLISYSLLGINSVSFDKFTTFKKNNYPNSSINENSIFLYKKI